MAQATTNQTYLIVAELSPDGRIVQVIEKEPTSIAEILNYYQRKEFLEKETEKQKRELHQLSVQHFSLKYKYEQLSQKNEVSLASLIGVLTAYGIYDPKKHTLNLESLIKPYLDKLLNDRANQEARLGFLEERWENFKLKHKLKFKNILLNAANWFASLFTKKKNKI